MEVILIIGALIFIGLAIGSAMIASRKGRSGFGWFVLTLIFPIAILFVAIAGPVSGATQVGPSSKRDTVKEERDAAIAQAEAGNVLGALTSAEKIGDPHSRTTAFTNIAYAQTEAGDIEGAKKTIAQAFATLETIKGSYDRANALRNIAWTQAEVGDVEGAKKTIAKALSAAEKIKDATFRKKAFASITKAKARILQPSQKSPSNLPVDQPIVSDSRSTPNRSEPTIHPPGGASEPSESSPALEYTVSTQTAAMRSDGGTTTHNQASTLDWELLLKYDPDVMRSVDKLKPYGEPAIEEFKRAYAAVGGDRSAINHITDVIINDFDKKIHDS